MLTFGWADIPVLPKVSRFKSGTYSGRYLNNGYVLGQKPNILVGPEAAIGGKPPPTFSICVQFKTSLKGMKLTRSPISSVVPSTTSTKPSAHAALRNTPELWLR